MGFVECGTGSYSETCVSCDNRTEVVSIKFEEAIDIKDEIPEATPFPPIKTENEVMLSVVFEVVVAAHAFRPFIAPKSKL
jgi:hypothetical protein